MCSALAKDDAPILDGLVSDPERALAEIYARYKHIFMGYTRNIGGDPDLRTETYHDSILAFYDIWLEGRYDPSMASVSTLICAIGKNKLLSKLGKQKKEMQVASLEGMVLPNDEDDTIHVREEMFDKIEGALERLGDGCREIIGMFYYQKMSIGHIAHKLQYKNENVVKAHKSRCMKRLRELMQSSGS